MEKYAVSGRLRPDWGNTSRAAMARLGSKGLKGHSRQQWLNESKYSKVKKTIEIKPVSPTEVCGKV